MTFSRTSPAEPTSTFIDLTDTSTTDLIATLTNSAALRMIHICNDSGSSATITVDRYDGTDAVKFLGAKSIAANDVYTLEIDVQLDVGDSVRAAASAPNALHVITTYLQGAGR